MKGIGSVRLAAALAAFTFCSGVCRAQRCPAGTVFSSMEEAGEELIVHCARSKGLRAALVALKESELGRRVLAFLEERKIPIRVDGKREWDPNSGAAFDPAQRVVLLPPGAAERPSVSLAISLAHEGYHAIQSVERGMVRCVEAEQDAFFAQNVAYVEMRKKGGVGLPPGDPLRKDFAVFAKFVSNGSLKGLDNLVMKAHAAKRWAILHSGSIVYRLFVPLGHFLYNYAEGFETLEQRKGHPDYWWDKRPVKRTAEEHERDREWRQRWVEDHRYSLPSD